LNLCVQYNAGKIPQESATPLFDAKVLADKIEKEFQGFQLHVAITAIFTELAALNKWLTDEAPWHLKGDETLSKRRAIVRTVLEALYILSHFLEPFIPNTVAEIFTRLGTKPRTIGNAVLVAWHALEPGSPIVASKNVLFPRFGPSRFEKEEEALHSSGEHLAPAEKHAGKEKEKQQKAASVQDDKIDISKVDLRVGRILSVERHAQADHLYVEQIDVGEAKPRQVCSGLAKFIPIEEMRDRLLVVVCNMKATNFRGVRSEAMVLAANNADGTIVELVDPPSGAKPGTKITVEGFAGVPEKELSPKLKIFETVKPDLKTNAERVACYKGVALKTEDGRVCSVKSLSDAHLG